MTPAKIKKDLLERFEKANYTAITIVIEKGTIPISILPILYSTHSDKPFSQNVRCFLMSCPDVKLFGAESLAELVQTLFVFEDLLKIQLEERSSCKKHYDQILEKCKNEPDGLYRLDKDYKQYVLEHEHVFGFHPYFLTFGVAINLTALTASVQFDETRHAELCRLYLNK